MSNRPLPQTHTFCGKKFELIFSKLDGLCGKKDKNWLVVQRDLNTLIGLETVIHESIHACDWSLTEQDVTRMAHDIARLVWRLDYRRQDG